LLTPINEASDEISPHPNFMKDFDYWVGCEAQWRNGEATVPSYSVSSPKWCVDVGTTTATLPWRADKVPFPDLPNLDKEWCIQHEDSNSAPEIYVYALDRLASPVQPSSAQAAASSQLEPEPLAQPLFSVSGVLAPGAAPTFTVPIEVVLTATFQVFASPQVSVSLLTPNNELVDPSTPAANPQVTYTVQPGDEFSFYQYRVDAPADGV
jgi:LysM repeat protein